MPNIIKSVVPKILFCAGDLVSTCAGAEHQEEVAGSTRWQLNPTSSAVTQKRPMAVT